jgi:hypothetical protein
MRLRLALATFVLALVVIVSGCARNKAATSAEPGATEMSETIPLAPEFRIPDLPIPAGFEFDRPNSFVFQNKMIDVGRIQYVGKEPIGDVAQFYIDEMPHYNWTLLNVAEHDIVTMSFEKEGKGCMVVLTPKRIRGTIIQITFYPKVAPKATPEY